MSEKSRAVACDVGTMFFQTAERKEKDEVKFNTIRNSFVQIEETDDIEDVLKQNSWQYLKGEGKYFVLGEDSLRVAKLFPGKVDLRRPLQDGVLNKDEPSKMLVLSEMIRLSLGDPTDSKSVVCACISSPPIDGSVDSAFHKARLTGMFKRLGWNVKIIEEGLAVILSERPTVTESDGKEAPYSGFGISFGAGKINCVLAYKGLQILGMSNKKSGDWIDQKVSEQLGVPLAQVTSKKERELDFSNLPEDDDILYALDIYYGVMIENVFNHFAKKFIEVDSEFDAPLDIVIAGGTSMPKGFQSKVEEVIRGLKLPFRIKDIRVSDDPRNSVVKGCLTQAIITQKKIEKATEDELSAILGE